MSDSLIRDMQKLCEEFEESRGETPAEIHVDQSHDDEWRSSAHGHRKAETLEHSEYALCFMDDDGNVYDYVHRMPRLFRFVDSRQKTHELPVHYGHEKFVASWWQAVVSVFVVTLECGSFQEQANRRIDFMNW